MKAIRNADGTTILPDHAWHWRNYGLWAYLQRLKHSDSPILCGPWRGEVGFEVLYWIPFLEQIAHLTGIPKARFIPISRGGASSWYGTPTGIELYAMRTPQQCRVANREQVAKTGMFKQIAWSPFDRQIVRDAAETLKVTKYHTLHPAWMYIRMAPYWTMQRGMDWLNAQLRFSTLPAPTVPLDLPSDFVAVRFYARQTFPANDKSVYPFIEALMMTVQQNTSIIILDSDLPLDDHRDLTTGIRGPKIQHLSELLPLDAPTNLATMSAVLAKAKGFVGTYGGFAQLALRLGVPSASFYTHWGATSIAHKHLADTIATRSGRPAHVIRVGDLPMLNAILPETSVTPVQRSPLQLPETALQSA